jgi:phospholipase/carboxylesterase
MKKILIIIVLIAAYFWWRQDSEISSLDGKTSFSYILRYSGSAASSDTLPLLIALHGNGDTAENFYDIALADLSEPARIALIRAPISYGMGKAWPMDETKLHEFGPAFHESVLEISKKYPTKGKPLLFGFSGGGVMSYYQAFYFGDDYQAIFPISAKLPIRFEDESPGSWQTRVYAFHGKNDDVIPFREGKKISDFLLERGFSLEFGETPGGHLAVFEEMKTEVLSDLEFAIRSLRG